MTDFNRAACKMQPQASACGGTGWKACATMEILSDLEKSLVSKWILQEAQQTGKIMQEVTVMIALPLTPWPPAAVPLPLL